MHASADFAQKKSAFSTESLSFVITESFIYFRHTTAIYPQLRNEKL
ncbi:hypothetical protein C8C98_3863 [Acidovorax sp. 106]|nr:hypothetical protein C8C98_3863 [Acidovorax sp. 106]